MPNIFFTKSVKFLDSVLGDLEVPDTRTNFSVPTCIGKDMILELTLESLEPIYDSILYYDPALFVRSNTLPSNYPEKSESYWKVAIEGTANALWQYGEFVGDETQRNYKVRARIPNTDRKTIVIEHRFYVTADVTTFLEDIELENRDRLLKANMNYDVDGDYLDIGSVYNQSESLQIGMKPFIYTESPDSNYQIWVKSDRVTVKRNDGGNFSSEGFTNGFSAVLFKQDTNGKFETIVFSGGQIANISTSTIDIMGTPTATVTNDYVTVWGLTIQANIVRQYLSGDGVLAKTVYYDWFRFDADFYNQGNFNYHDFSIVGKNDPNLDLNKPNSISCKFSYSGGNVDWADFWVVRKTDVSNQTNFVEAYGNHPNGLGSVDTIQNLGGDLWEAIWDMNNITLEKDNLYHIVAVLYNKANREVGSLISPEFGVDDLPEVLAIPTITGSFRDYKREYKTNALNVHYYDRYNAILKIDKKSYERLLTNQGGDFDTNINYVKVSFGSDVYNLPNIGVRKWKAGGNLDYGFSPILDSDEYLTILFRFRVSPDLTTGERSINWEIGFQSEPNILHYEQKVNIQDYDTTFFTEFELRDLQDAAISTFYEQDNGVKCFGEITDDGNLYMLMALIDNSGNIREWEEEPQTFTQLRQRQDTDLQNVTLFSDVSQQFDGSEQGEFTFQHASLGSDSYVVMIAKLKEGVQEGIDYWTIESDFIVQ